MPDDQRRQITGRDPVATLDDEPRSVLFKAERTKRKFSDFGRKQEYVCQLIINSPVDYVVSFRLHTSIASRAQLTALAVHVVILVIPTIISTEILHIIIKATTQKKIRCKFFVFVTGQIRLRRLLP